MLKRITISVEIDGLVTGISKEFDEDEVRRLRDQFEGESLKYALVSIAQREAMSLAVQGINYLFDLPEEWWKGDSG